MTARAETPLAMAPFQAGLTNQKLALLGLALRAREEGRAIALPRLVDFRPGTAGPAIPLDAVLDRAALADGLASFGVEVREGGEPLDPAPLFLAAGTRIADLRRAGRLDELRALGRLLVAMRPAPSLVIPALPLGTIGLQLRVERDWQVYVRDHLAPAFPRETLYLDHLAILSRVTESFGDGLTLYATCNVEDLAVEPARIAEDARAMAGHRLIFRRDLGDGHPPGGLAGAVTDFALALGLPRLIGHSRSTFFNALALARFGETGEASDDIWLYNVGGARLKRRTDQGAFVRPWAATTA